MKGSVQQHLRLVLTGLCFAAQILNPATTAKAQTQSPFLHQGDVGLETSYIHYEEPDIMKEKGWMTGVFGVYTLRMQDNQPVGSLAEFLSHYGDNKMFRVDGKFSYGEVDYDSNGTGSIDSIEDFMFETRATAGYDFPVLQTTTITPYTGLGYRYLNDDSSGKTSTTGHVGYERESNYFYLPLGLETQTKLAQGGWSWGLSFEYDLFLNGKQKSHLEDVSPLLNTLDNDQDSGFGLRGSLRLLKEFQNVEWLIEPFFRYWSIEDSEVGTIVCGGTPCALGFEPENESREYGIKLGASF
jgi:hypothetical protein